MNVTNHMIKGLLSDSSLEAVQQSPFGRPKLLIRRAITQHIASFFDAEGINRPFLDSFLPAVQCYDAGTTPTPAEDSPLSRRIAIARLFDNTKFELPAILITDSGVTTRPAGLGSYDGIHRHKDHGLIARLTNSVVASISLTIGSMDQTTTDDIASAVALIFTSLRRVSGGDEIRVSNQDSLDSNVINASGVIVLPMGEISVPPANPNPVGEDSRQMMYITSIDIPNITFESSVYVGYRNKVASSDLRGLADRESFLAQTNSEIVAPSTIRVNHNTQVLVKNMPFEGVLYSSDPKIAIIRGMTIIPRRVGSFDLRLVRPGSSSEEDRILDSKTIQVTWN